MALTVMLLPVPYADAATSSPSAPARASGITSSGAASSGESPAHGTASSGLAAAAGPTLSVGDVAVHEGDAMTRSAAFTVSLSEAATGTVTVNYATANDTATRPGDYTARSATLTFSAGQVSKTVSVPVKGDTAAEGNETFNLNLSSASGATVADAIGTATIRNDDPGSGLRLAVGDVVVHEGNTATRPAVFTVSLSQPATGTVTVDYATADDTATQPDYTSKSGPLTFSAGQVSRTVSVPVKGDPAVEADETFNLNLSNATGGATITDGSGLGTIVDDEVGCRSSITFGRVVACSIDAPNEVDRFTFASVANDLIQARVVRTSGTRNLAVEIYDANGFLRCWTFPGTDVTAQCVVPTAAGEVWVRGDGATGSTGYNLSVQRLNNPGRCIGRVGLGSTTPGVIDPVAEDDCYPFASAANDVIQARVVRTSGTGNLSVRIYDANGVLRCWTFPGTDVTTQCAVPTAGGHVRVLGDSTTANTGYNLSVQRLNNPGGCTPVGFGSPTSGVIDPVAEDDCYPFTSAPNDVIQARVVRTSGTGVLAVQIYDANGVLRCWTFPGTDATTQCAVPTAGGHVRVLGDQSTANTGYNLSVQRLNNPGGCTPVGFGPITPTSGVIVPIGEDDCYTFDSVAGDVIQARVVRTSGTGVLAVQIYDATGAPRCGSFFGTDVTTQCAVPTAGGHVRVLGDSTTANTGYTLSLRRP